MIFQQRGALLYYENIVRQYVDQKLRNRWIGRGGSFQRSPRSADLTPSDIFCLDYIKLHVYRELSENIVELGENISHAIASITGKTLQKLLKITENKILFVVRQHDGQFDK